MIRDQVRSVLFIATACTLLGCGSDGNVTLKLGTYNASRALSATTLCFKRLRFKMSSETTSSDVTSDSDNVDFTPGEITLSDSGTNLGATTIPEGTYERLEFDLERDGSGCTSGKSVQITNASGTFSTTDRVTIKFEGTFTATSSNKVLELGVQNIVNALNAVTNSNNIKDDLEAAGVKGTL